MIFDNSLLFTLLIPLIACVGAAVIPFPNIRDAFNVAISLLFLGNIIKLLAIFKAGQEALSFSFGEILPGLPLAFSTEPLGMLFIIVLSVLWVVSIVYSIGYMRSNNEQHQNRFYSFFALSILASVGVAFASNLLTLFIFYELLTLSTYPLVTHSGTTEAKKAGRTYLGILLGSSMLLLLPAILITYNSTGTLDFTKGGILSGKANEGVSAILLFLFVFGTAKAALMPLHRWLPSAMVAPAPVSGLLHAVAVVKVGVFTLVKIIIYIFGVDYLQSFMHWDWYAGDWLLYISSFTIITASIAALRQDSIKKMLAYSTISQLSYIILSLAILSPKTIIAAVLQIAAHAFGKITLFFAAGAIQTSAQKTKISQLAGVGRRMPWTMTAFTIAAISMIGVPPTFGFISKWYMVDGVLASEAYWVLGVIVLSMVLNTAYFLPVIFKAFFEKEKASDGVSIVRVYGEANIAMVIATIFTALATLVLFFHPGIFLELARALVDTALPVPVTDGVSE
jgi:multicomponent Na+:H+ antiporter subunit D